MAQKINWKNEYLFKSRKEVASTQSVMEQTLQILKQLNLKYEVIAEGPECLEVTYQSFKFLIEAVKDRRYITISIQNFDSFQIDEEEENLRIHDIINKNNRIHFTKLCCTNEDGSVQVDCKIDLLLIPEIPDCSNYFLCALQMIITNITSYFKMKKGVQEDPVHQPKEEVYYFKTAQQIKKRPNVLDLLFPILDEMKIKYKRQHEDVLVFRYKDFDFSVYGGKDWNYIILTAWYLDVLDPSDDNDINKSNSVIDYINSSLTPRFFYMDVPDGSILVVAKMDLLWIPEIPELGRWFRTGLKNLMDAYMIYNDMKQDPGGIVDAISLGFSSPTPYQA